MMLAGEEFIADTHDQGMGGSSSVGWRDWRGQHRLQDGSAYNLTRDQIVADAEMF